MGSVPQQQAERMERETRVGRRSFNIQALGLVVQTAGHMRASFGRACDPRLLPIGVDPGDVR